MARREGALVLDRAVELVELVAGALLDDRRARDRRSSARLAAARAGQALAHHQRDGVLQRRVGAVGDLVV